MAKEKKTTKKPAKKPAKKRNILTEISKTKEPEPGKAPETHDVKDDENTTASKPIKNSRKNQSTEEKRKKDAEYQKEKRAREKEEKEKKSEQECKELQLAVETFACMPFDFMAKRDPKWTLTQDERKAFSGSAIALMDKYASVLSGYAVETSFVLCAASILVPRLMFNEKEHQQINSNTWQEGDRKDAPGQTNDRVSHKGGGV